MPVGAIAGAAVGGLSGALSNQKEGGKQASNYMSGFIDPNQAAGNLNAANNAAANINTRDASQRVMDNPLYSGLFDAGGQLGQAENEATQLANTGYNLTPEDHTAYGQASGDISRMFGQNEQSLSKSLANRGLSNSNVAQAQFSGLQGNKNEQLAGLQTKIANDRMNMNLQRLGQTRNFMTQLGGQAQSAVNQDLGAVKDTANLEYQMGMGKLGALQGQSNEGLQQDQQTQHSSGLSNAFGGMASGGLSGALIQNGMSGPKKPGMS